MSSIGIHGGSSSGGGGGTEADPSEVDIIQVGSAGITLGQKTAALSFPVVFPSDGTLPLPSGAATSAKQDTLLTELQLKADLSETQPVSGPQTDAEARATKTASGTINDVNDIISLALTGNQGVLVFFSNNSSLSAQLVAQVSHDNTNWSETSWVLVSNGNVRNSLYRLRDADAAGHWMVFIPGGATNVRVKCNSFVSGSVDVAIAATNTPFQEISFVGRPETDTAPPFGIAQVGGPFGQAAGYLRAAWTTNAEPAQNDVGFVTRPRPFRATTSAVTAVADTASSAQLLASNGGRVGATIMNDSSAVLYVKFGATASATDYTVRLVQYAYYEVPFGYFGRIDGIWASDPGDGAARITELTT